MGGVLLLVLALQAQAPVQVGARLTEEEIHAGETTILRVDVETEGPRAQIRRFRTLPPGIEVVATRDYDQRQFSLPGGTRRFITREFVLRAAAAGRYRIPSLEVAVEGEVFSTRSLLLTVTSGPTRQRGEMPGARDGVVLQAWLDSDTVFVGEQVTLEVEAMFSQEARMRLRRAPEYEAPSPSGFWVHDLPEPGRPVSRSVGDRIYEVQQFRRAFFPLSPGSYTIPPARLEYEMRRGLLYAPETRELTSDPLPLVVLPIPAAQPPAFQGAVGEYTLRARVEPATVPVGEAAVLTLEVSGAGNVKALPAPALPEVAGLDVFPPSEEAESRARGSTIQGRKTFSWVLIPRRAGELEIPSIRYAYFNPAAGGFETATVAPLPLRATPTASSGARAAPATLRFLKTAPGSDPLAWVRSSWFSALQALPLVLLAGALLWHLRQRRRGRVTARGLRRQRQQRVGALEQRADDAADDTLFADAEVFARDWLARRLGLSTGAVTDTEALRGAGVPGGVADGVRRVLDRLSAGRYAPTPPSPAERRAVVGELKRVLEAVDGAAPRGAMGRERTARPASAARGTGVIALAALGTLGALGAPPPAVAAGVQEAEADTAAPQEDASSSIGPFDRGLRAFEQGQFAEAAAAFDQYVRSDPDDAAGWYNLGTAYHRAGQPGRGVWAWLRALSLDPRDGDARHNLRVAGTPPELVQRVTPAVPLRATELLLLAAIAWLAAGVAAAGWIVRRGRGAGIGAVVALTLAVGLVGVWWGSTRGAETRIVLDGATLRAGPTMRSEPVTVLEPGTGLVPVERYGDWLRARTLRGEEGWLEHDRTGRL